MYRRKSALRKGDFKKKMKKNVKGLYSLTICLLITLTASTIAVSGNETKTEATTTNKIYEVESTTHQINITQEAFTNPLVTVTSRRKIIAKKIIKVKNVKVKVKKTMKVSSKQKIKVTNVSPKLANNKKIKMTNKTKKIIKLKNGKVTAKNPGTGKIVIESKDGGYKDVINIKVKKPVLKCQGVKLLYSAKYSITKNPLTASMGVKRFNGHKETYYSQRVLSGGGLKIPGRHIANDETIRDKDGYIVVATDYSFKPKHSTFITSLGPAKVYDTGCAYGVVDIYCNW